MYLIKELRSIEVFYCRLRQLDALKQKSKMIILPIPSTLLKRIRTAESVIIEESITEPNSVLNSPTNHEPPSSQREETASNGDPINGNSIRSEISRRFVAEKMKANKETKPRLRALGISETEVPAFLEQYAAMIPRKLLESYLALPELLEKSLTGYEPRWLCFTEIDHVNYSSIKGLVVFYIEYN